MSNMLSTNGPIGYRLQQARMQSGLSAPQVARLMDLPGTAVLNLEADCCCSPCVIEQLCAIYGVSHRWMITGEREVSIRHLAEARDRLLGLGIPGNEVSRIVSVLGTLAVEDDQ